MTAKPSPFPLGELAMTTLAYAVAVALTALVILPAILTPLPLAAFATDAPPVVARTPVIEKPS